jgi:hypothetical protein
VNIGFFPGILIVEESFMTICIKVATQTHCYLIPIAEFPLIFRHPGPGPVNYPELFQDATLVSLQSAAEKVSDIGVRNALQRGIDAATEALQKRGGEHVTINPEGHSDAS